MSARSQTPAVALADDPLILLDDGVYYVELATGHPAGHEPGYLFIRVDSKQSDCLGVFEREADGREERWQARISVPFDDESNDDSMIVVHVAHGGGRIAAVVALWRARRLAHRPAD